MKQSIAGSSGTPKSVAAAEAVNKTIFSLISSSMRGEETPRHYFDVGVIGYGHDVRSALPGDQILRPLPNVAVAPLGTGSDGVPLFVQPRHDGDATRMSSAFYQAGATLRDWVAAHDESFPPVVINISDGRDNEANPPDGVGAEEWADRLRSLRTQAGNLILLNVALADDGSGKSVLFPTDDGEIDDDYGRFLFRISSNIHPLMAEYAGGKNLGRVTSASKAFAFNVGVELLPTLLDIGTKPLPVL